MLGFALGPAGSTVEGISSSSKPVSAGGASSELSSRLRDALARARAEVGAALAAGGGGVHAAALLSDRCDEIVRELYRHARGRHAVDLALVATGGWGRREVCPYSDIDFI